MKKIDRAHRYAALVILGSINVTLVHAHSSLYRFVRLDCRDVLTDKEKEFIMKRHATIDKANRELIALGAHMRDQYNRNA